MKIWLISDTHCRHDLLQIPSGVEMVVHCGDESNAHKSKQNVEEANSFFEWYQALPIPQKVFVPGNHSMAIEHGLIKPEYYPGVTFLIHQLSEFDWTGLGVADNRKFKIFGSPYTPWFFNWAYNLARPDLKAIWQSIPADVDLLVTHGPPKGILDVTKDWKTKEPIHIGSLSLTREVLHRIKPTLHAFGHLHDETGIKNFGWLDRQSVTFVNCSCCNLEGQLIHHGVIVEVSQQGLLQISEYVPTHEQ